jgi:hypothetical protein
VEVFIIKLEMNVHVRNQILPVNALAQRLVLRGLFLVEPVARLAEANQSQMKIQKRIPIPVEVLALPITMETTTLKMRQPTLRPLAPRPLYASMTV